MYQPPGIFPSVEQVELFSQQLQKTATATTATDTVTTIQEENEDVELFTLPSTTSASSVSLSMTINDLDGSVVNGNGFDGNSEQYKDRGYDVNDMTQNTTEEGKDLFTDPLLPPSIILASTATTDSSLTGSTSGQLMVSTITNPQPSPSPLISTRSENIRLASLLERFVELSKMDGRFYLCDHQDMIVISNWLHSIPLTLAERFTFANAPVSLRDTLSVNVLYQFAATYALRRPVALNIRLSRQKPR